MVVTGLLFFVHGTLGRLHSSLAETVGIAVSNYWIITFVALLVWFPGGRRRWSASERFVIGAFVVAEVVLALVWMLFAEVPRNLALVWPNPHVAGAVDKAAGALGFAASVCLAILLAARWLKATQPVRRASAPAAIGALTLLFLGALILQGVFTATQSPLLVWPTLVGLVLVPVVFLAGVWRAWVARASVGDLLVDLGSMSGRPLQPALAKALGDPTLTLAYWLPQFGSYADSDGQKLELPAEDGKRLVAVVEQDGERVAAIAYDASLAEERKLLDAVVAAAGITLRNERLAAELRARVNELSASRARIVGAGTKSVAGSSETCMTARNSDWSRSECSFACSVHESGPIRRQRRRWSPTRRPNWRHRSMSCASLRTASTQLSSTTASPLRWNHSPHARP